jgi:hypothetical protein
VSRSDPVYTTPLDQKLGIKPGQRVEIIAVDDASLVDLVEEAGAEVTIGSPGDPLDLIFLGAETIGDLECLPELRRRLRPAGAIWVVSTKGKAATLRDTEVIEAAITSGLVDNKVVSFSATKTSARLVIRVVDRAAHAAELEAAARE